MRPPWDAISTRCATEAVGAAGSASTAPGSLWAWRGAATARDLWFFSADALTASPFGAYKPALARAERLRAPVFVAQWARFFEDPMANTSSAKKAVRKIARKTAINRSRRTEMRTYVRKVEEAIASGDAKAAADALHAAETKVMRAAQKGIVHKNTASRKVSRLTVRVKALAK